MKTFDSIQFDRQLQLSFNADSVLFYFQSFDRLLKFALQHCETSEDYNLLCDEVMFSKSRLESFIKTHICNEHNETCKGATSPSEDD